MDKLSRDKVFAYRKAWERFAPIHSKPIDQITISDLRSCVELNTSSYYPARDMRQLAVNLFKLAALEGWVDASLPRSIILPSPDEKSREAFTAEEQQALWHSYDSGDKRAAVPLLMIYTGMMPCEVQRLSASMVDLDRCVIVGAGSSKTKVRK